MPSTRRWIVVGTIGAACGVLLGVIVWSLTASGLAAALVGTAVASILLVLAVGGATHNATFARTPDRMAKVAAKRRRVQQAIEETKRSGGAGTGR